MLKITIPQPCQQDWDAMTPDQQGRHCTACAKTVVDFTSLADEEIKFFLLRKQEKNLCGRFRNDQLQRITITLPENILRIDLPLWKQFLTACLLAFSSMLFSCNAVIDHKTGQTMGEPIPVVVQQNPVSDKVVVGGFNFDIDSMPAQLPPPVCKSTMGVTMVCETYTQGVTFVQSVPPEEIIEETTCPVPLVDSSGISQITTTLSDPASTKNPPKADSTDCNTMKYY